MYRRTPLLAALAAAAAVLAAPSAALAVTGTTNKRCYSHVPAAGSQPIVVKLTGGVPGAGFDLAALGSNGGVAGTGTGTYDAAGNAVAQIANAVPPGGSVKPMRGKKLHLAVRTYAPTGTFDTALKDVLITNFTVTVASKPIKPRKRRKVTVSGTPFAHKKVYGFVVKGKKKKVLHRFKLGRGNVCGYVRNKVKVAPRHYHTGRYRLYLNAGKHLHRHRALRYDFRIYHRYY